MNVLDRNEVQQPLHPDLPAQRGRQAPARGRLQLINASNRARRLLRITRAEHLLDGAPSRATQDHDA